MSTIIKAVLFDFGETLLTFGKVKVMQVFSQSARQTYAYLIKEGQPAGHFWWYFIRNIAAIRVRNLWGNITRRDFDALSLLKSFGISRGYTLNEEQWRDVGWLWYEPLNRLAKAEIDIRDTLSKLRQMGLKLGILSNTFISAGSLDRQLEQFGMLEFFPCRLYSYQFGFRKPDGRIFDAAVKRIGVPAENILFVGDRIDKDIKPALRQGMRTIMKTAYTNRGKTVPDGVIKIERIAELPSIITKINSTAEHAESAEKKIKDIFTPKRARIDAKII